MPKARTAAAIAAHRRLRGGRSPARTCRPTTATSRTETTSAGVIETAPEISPPPVGTQTASTVRAASRGAGLRFTSAALQAQHRGHGGDDDPYVPPERPVFNVEIVEPHSVLNGRRPTQVVDLREAGQPGRHAHPGRVAPVPVDEPGDVDRQLRPWADDAHVPPQDVPQLW